MVRAASPYDYLSLNPMEIAPSGITREDNVEVLILFPGGDYSYLTMGKTDFKIREQILKVRFGDEIIISPNISPDLKRYTIQLNALASPANRREYCFRVFGQNPNSSSAIMHIHEEIKDPP